jgi:hypothetical protein
MIGSFDAYGLPPKSRGYTAVIDSPNKIARLGMRS